MIADLPRDMEEEVLSRIPVRSLRSVRSTCKKWNTLSKAESFAKKHLGRHATEQKEFTVVMMMNLRVYLTSVNLDVDPCTKHEGRLISRTRTTIKSIYLMYFIATVYCYASQRTTLGSLFGTRIGDKPGRSSPHMIFIDWTGIAMLLENHAGATKS
uniref:Putative F-box protein n=1 Tax=Noccaea caerulescens TaxID=107243 RepID=A0A1J3GET5_NOCCA